MYIYLILLLAIAQGAHSIGIRQLTLPVDHTECPTWDNRTGILYYVDIHSGQILGFDFAKNILVKNVTLENSSVAPVLQTKEPNVFLVGRNKSIVSVDVDSEDNKINELASVQEDFPRSRFNDGKVDSKGRVWIGTIGYEGEDGNLEPNGGALYLVTKENLTDPILVLAPVNVSNGMAWNMNDDKFYYIDSPTKQIVEYDFDNETGQISNRRVVFDLEKHDLDAVPDGMTIDTDDNLWVALYGGGAVIQVDPRKGTLVRNVLMPAKYVTSVAWGGRNGDILFVTTSRIRLNDEERRKQPAAGAVFAITELGAKGLLPFEADIL